MPRQRRLVQQWSAYAHKMFKLFDKDLEFKATRALSEAHSIAIYFSTAPCKIVTK